MMTRKKKQHLPTRLAVEEKQIDTRNVPGWLHITTEVVLHSTEILPVGIFGRMAFIGGALNVVFRYQDVLNTDRDQTWAEWKAEAPGVVPIPAYDIKTLRKFYIICYAPSDVDFTEWFMLEGLEVTQPPKIGKERLAKLSQFSGS